MSEQARTTAAGRLRAALDSGKPVVAAYAADPLTVKLVERLGFPAAYLGGGALGYLLGTTEARLTSTDVLNVVRQITAVCDLPLIVDGTTGFGDPIHVLRTVRELERAGAAGIEIEDQLTPKHAHHHRGIDHPVTLEAMVEKVQAAVEAREDPDFLIIARTNTIGEVSLEEGIRRARAYAEAGADMVLVLPRTEDEYRRLPAEVPKPLVAMTIAVARPPLFTPAQLHAFGYPLVLEAQAGMLAAYAAVRRGYRQILEQGYIPMDPQELRELRAEMDELCDLPRLWALEERTTERPDRLPAYK
ncbi:MAG: isocitrate lyase/PEP mutase family protein [Dehalococcoidia bacterium]